MWIFQLTIDDSIYRFCISITVFTGLPQHYFRHPHQGKYSDRRAVRDAELHGAMRRKWTSPSCFQQCNQTEVDTRVPSLWPQDRTWEQSHCTRTCIQVSTVIGWSPWQESHHSLLQATSRMGSVASASTIMWRATCICTLFRTFITKRNHKSKLEN